MFPDCSGNLAEWFSSVIPENLSFNCGTGHWKVCSQWYHTISQNRIPFATLNPHIFHANLAPQSRCQSRPPAFPTLCVLKLEAIWGQNTNDLMGGLMLTPFTQESPDHQKSTSRSASLFATVARSELQVPGEPLQAPCPKTPRRGAIWVCVNRATRKIVVCFWLPL